MKRKRGRPKVNKQEVNEDAKEKTSEIPEEQDSPMRPKADLRMPKPDQKVDFFHKEYAFESLPLTGTQRIVTDKQLVLYARYFLGQLRVLRVQKAFEFAKSISLVLTVRKKEEV